MIRIEQVNYSVGTFALRDVSLSVAAGEYFVLLGPTGSGKTVLVECLCGLNRIDSGRIFIGEADVTHEEPRSRGVGYLPQDYALFPHKTVRGNIGFGLRNRREFPAEIRQQVDQLMDQLGLAHLADRLPEKLSGGEKQRVALARALAVRPRVLLLDEPVSALDEQTRDDLCRKLKQLQRETKTTTVHVCHNFAEMLSVADRIGILEQGRILQVGTPQEILERPNSARVARFVQAGNLLSAREWMYLAGADGMGFRGRRFGFDGPAGDVVVMIRPENIHLQSALLEKDKLPGTTIPSTTIPGAAILEGTICEVVDLGPVVKVTVGCRGSAGHPQGSSSEKQTEMLVLLGKKEYKDCQAGVGDRVHLAVAPEDVHVMQQ